MPDIKVKDVAKGTVKAIDKSATAAQRMKNAYIRTKEKAEHSAVPQEGSPEEYAAGRVSSGLDSAQKAVREFDRQGRKGVKTTKENISKAKDFFEKRAVNQPKKQAQRKAAESIRRTTGNAKKTIKTVDRGGKTIKQTAKSTAKGTVKTARKTVKTAERTAKTTIKTTQQAAKAAQKTAQAMNGCPSTPKAPNMAGKIPSRNAGTAMSNLFCGGLHGQMWQTAIWSAPDMRNASTTAAMPSVGCWSSLRSMRVWLPEPWRKRVLSLTDVN